MENSCLQQQVSLTIFTVPLHSQPSWGFCFLRADLRMLKEIYHYFTLFIWCPLKGTCGN